MGGCERYLRREEGKFARAVIAAGKARERRNRKTAAGVLGSQLIREHRPDADEVPDHRR